MRNHWTLLICLIGICAFCLAACGGNVEHNDSQQTNLQPPDITACAAWTKDQNLHAGKDEKAGQIASSAVAQDGTLVVLINDWPNGTCRIAESIAGQWQDVATAALTQCLRADTSADGYIEVIAQTGQDAYLLLERRPNGQWQAIQTPEKLIPRAAVHAKTGTQLLCEKSLLSLNGPGENTSLYSLSEQGWIQGQINPASIFKLVAFGFLGEHLAALGSTSDEVGNSQALILTQGADNGWQTSPFPAQAKSVSMLISQGQDVMAFAQDAEGKNAAYFSWDGGSGWALADTQGAQAATGLVATDGFLLAATPQAPDSGLWISGKEPVQLGQVLINGQSNTITPEGPKGIPTSLALASSGLVLITTQGVFYSICR